MMPSITKCLPKMSEIRSCKPHCQCQRNSTFIKSYILLVPILKIKRIFRLYVVEKDTTTKTQTAIDLVSNEYDSGENKLLIKNILNQLLDTIIFENSNKKTQFSNSGVVEEPISVVRNIVEKKDYTDEGQVTSRFIIDILLDLVIEKGERNWLTDYCNSLLDSILLNITDNTSTSSIWPDSFPNLDNNEFFKSPEINLNPIFGNNYDLNTDFLKIRKRMIKKTIKHMTRAQVKEIPPLDMIFNYSTIETLPSMEKSSNFKCEPVPKQLIVVDIDEFQSCEQNSFQAEDLKKVISMKYTFQKDIQTKSDHNYESVQTQTEYKSTKGEDEDEALKSWCQLLVESILLVLPNKDVQKKTKKNISEWLLNTELSTRLLYFSDNSVSSVHALIEALLDECTYYQKAIDTCSCKFYVKKHNFVSLVLNILHILTKFLALISIYQKNNILTFAHKTKYSTIYLRCYSYLLNFYDYNEIILTENFLEFEEFLKIHNNLFSLLLNLNFPINENMKNPNVFAVYKKLIKKSFVKILKLQSLRR